MAARHVPLGTAASSQQTPTGKPKRKKTTVIATAKGQPLPGSSTRDYYPLNHDECSHPEEKLIARGSASLQWLTCPSCGSRWERLDIAGEQRRAAEDLKTEVTETCLCGKPMKLRTNRQDDSIFLGCSDFPHCRRTRKFQPAPILQQQRPSSGATQSAEQRLADSAAAAWWTSAA